MLSSYRIRSALAIPLAFISLLLLVMLFVACFLPAFSGERLVVMVAFLLVSYSAVDAFCRRVSFKSEGIQIRRFLSSRELAWNEITHLGSLILGTKIYLLLTTTTSRSFYILSNNYDRFPELFRRLDEKLGTEKMDEGIRDLLEHPWKNNKPVYAAWFAVVVLLAVISGRLFPIPFK